MPDIEHIPKNALFGKYVIGSLLGCGAFAKVYRARNVRTGISVAIKVINKKKLSNTLISNVKREISIMSRLNHPYVVKLHEVCATKTKIYVVIELVKGGELFAKVAKGRFTEDLSRKYFQQLISAVGYCHSRGIFHRDLKPENLLLDDVNGTLKVTDFGLSALTDQIRSDGMLHTLCGTPAYVAPEILTKKGYDGAKVDVWSCGIILFVMNAGYLPFNDPNLMAMYKKIYKGEFKCPKWMSSDTKRFVSRLLDTNPETRITIDEIVKDPWFNKGYKEPKFHEEQVKVDEDRATSSLKLNAFDLISFSSGLDLSGLLVESYDYGERFVLRNASLENLVEKVEEVVGKGEKLRVKQRRKEWGGIELEGKDGNLGVGVEFYFFRLSDELVVVEAKRTGSDTQWYKEFWNNKMRPALLEIKQGT